MINPNTQITVKRGTTTDAVFGDIVDGTTVIFTAIPATLIERDKRVKVEQRWTTVTFYDVYVTSAYPLQVRDIVTDSAGSSYVVDSVRSGGTFVLSGQWATCSRITA